MLKKENFTEEHIRDLQSASHRDPLLLERSVYAFWPVGGHHESRHAVHL